MRAGVLLPLAALLAATFAGPALAGPGYHEPAVGACHDYGFKALRKTSEPRPPVDCSARHRALTVAVERLPRGRGYKPVRGAFRAVGAACHRAAAAALGTDPVTRAMSAYNVAWFIPTRAERRRGARWVRCDLVLGFRAPQPLPRPLLTAPLDFARTSCLTGRSFIVTACSQPHRFRASGAIILRGRFPGNRRLSRIGQRRCRARTSGRSYRYTWSSRQAWRAGAKRVVCYTKTRS